MAITLEPYNTITLSGAPEQLIAPGKAGSWYFQILNNGPGAVQVAQSAAALASSPFTLNSQLSFTPFLFGPSGVWVEGGGSISVALIPNNGTGAPTGAGAVTGGGGGGGGGGSQTPWLSDIDAASYSLNNVNTITGRSAALLTISGANIALTTTSYISLTTTYDVSLVPSRNVLLNPTGGNVGIYRTSLFYPAYLLDVAGDVNSTGCYRQNGVAFACSDGAGGIALSNVSTINGAAPGGGGSTLPAGANTQIQFNNNGAFGAASNFVWTTSGLGIGVASPQATVDITQLNPGSTSNNPNITTTASGAFRLTSWIGVLEVAASYNPPNNYFWIQAKGTGGGALGLCLNPLGGNVAIGTNQTVTPLFVAGPAQDPTLASNQGITVIANSTNVNSQLQLGLTANGRPFIQGVGYSGAWVGQALYLNPLGGNVAIGNMAPATLLDITGSFAYGIGLVVNPVVRIKNTASVSMSGIVIDTVVSGCGIELQTNGAYRADITQNGAGTLKLTSSSGGTGVIVLLGALVGAGNASPAYPLDVTGDVNSTGCYRQNGVAFACSDGATGIALNNITTINGAAPGGALQQFADLAAAQAALGAGTRSLWIDPNNAVYVT